MTDDVKRIIERTLVHEGGYVFDPNDKGGETKFGISKRAYPDVDIKNLTKDDAVCIYKRDYYDSMHLDLVTSARVRFKLFDIGVNCGPRTAIRLLQRGLDILPDDGVLGPKTAALVNVMEESNVLEEIVDELKAHYGNIIRKDPSQKRYFRGWMARAEDTGENL